jgi:hypothetical protein
MDLPELNTKITKALDGLEYGKIIITIHEKQIVKIVREEMQEVD